MPGVRALARVQMGDETTAGTAVAATFKYPGPFVPLEDARNLHFPDVATGVFGGEGYSVIRALGGRLPFGQHDAAFEVLPVWLAAGINGAAATPVGPGSDSEYVYTATMPTAAAPTAPKTQTIESGDDNAAEEMEYSYVENFELSGAIDEGWMIQGVWRGRQVTSGITFTAALTVPTGLEFIPFSGTKLYIDASGGTIGTTEKTGTLLSARLIWPMQFAPYGAASGQKYFAGVKAVDNRPQLEIVFEHDGTASTEIAAWRAQTWRLIRLSVLGSLIGGTTYKGMVIDVAGKWAKFEPIGELNGNHIAKGLLNIHYSDDDSLRGSIEITNALATLP